MYLGRLDLVFTLGLNLNALLIDDFFVFDHKCIIFDTPNPPNIQPIVALSTAILWTNLPLSLQTSKRIWLSLSRPMT